MTPIGYNYYVTQIIWLACQYTNPLNYCLLIRQTKFQYFYKGGGMKGMQPINDDFYIDRSKELGKGNYGIVYKGYHLSSNRIIAIKHIDRQMVDRLPSHEREINVMAQLAKIHHPNIMGYYGYEKNEHGLFFFIQFCSGGTLKHLIPQKISQIKVITLFRQLLHAMSYMNRLKKIHRDLKPDNILLDQNGELKIADFGLARDIDVGEILMTKGACTPLYAAPEVLKLETYDSKCDVWSAGLILYEMLTAKEFFGEVKTKKQLIKEIQAFQSIKTLGLPKQLHPSWDKVILSMLVYDKNARPSFEELAQSFKQSSRQIEKDLIKKYGYQAQQEDEGLRITKKLSPYQSIFRKDGKQDIQKKLKQQRSFNNINDLRKYLSFFRLKNQMRISLFRQFTNSVYPTLKNVYKYLLMFLSTATFISKAKEVAEQIRERKVSTPDAEVSYAQIEPIHEKEFDDLLADFSFKIQSSIAKFKQVLDAQIISKILGSYMGRGEERTIILECDNILKLIEDAKNNKFADHQIYNKLFLMLINKNQIFCKQTQLQKWSESEVKTYAKMRILGNLDSIILNANYRNDDYMRKKKQDLQNKSKKEIIEFIRPFNFK